MRNPLKPATFNSLINFWLLMAISFGYPHEIIRNLLYQIKRCFKMCYDGKKHRTTRMNDGARIMFRINKELRKKKRRASNDFSYLPTWVRPPGLYT
jgi:hypothetical protein